MKKRLRFGIIGCGVIAPSHAEVLQRLDDAEVAWACDLIADKAQSLATRYEIPHITTDYRTVLADRQVDAVCVCTDHASHVPITVAALEQGKHVLCEKALAATRQGMAAMFAAHAAHPELVFGAVFQHRFDPEYRCLKKMVDDGAFGTILTAGIQMRCLRTDQYYQGDKWRGTWDQEGGAVLINQAIHFIDIMQWVVGEVEAVCGTHSNLTHASSMEAEDTAAAVLRFKCGALGTLEATCSSHLGWEPTILVHGTEGSIEIRDGKPIKLRFMNRQREAEIAAEFAAALTRNDSSDAIGKTYYGSGHPAQILDFVQALHDGTPLVVTAASARKTVDLVLGVYQSQRDQKWVKLTTP